MTQLQHLSHPKYRPDIDGLRAIAVLSVVFFHAFPSWMKGGFIGVDIFFVISGYLISTIILQNLENGTFSFSEFYARRVTRIFPALLLVLIASYTFGWFALLADEYKQLGKHMAAGAGFVSNIILWNEAGYFDNLADTKPLLHLWSLGIEEQFYIVWPLLLWLAWNRKFNAITITVLVALVSFYLNITGVQKDAVAAFYSPQTRFWELLCGSLLAWVGLYKKEACATFGLKLDGWLIKIIYREPGNADGQTLANVFSLVGLLLLLYGFWQINKDLDFPGRWAVVPVLGAVLIICPGQNAWVNRTLLSNKLVIWFGLISFPLYLWHWPILSFARIVESEVPSGNIRVVAVVLSVVLAWFTYWLVERPVRFGKNTNIKAAVLAVLMSFFAYVGYNTYGRDGYEFRESVKHRKNNKNELIRTPASDKECLQYIGIQSPLFPYCRFTNIGSRKTIAVVGDSHAHVAYPGIAEFFKSRDRNTVLLANSSCPPLLGVASGKNEAERVACGLRIEQLINVLVSYKDIDKVFFFVRGPMYVTGTEPVTGDKNVTGSKTISYDDFFNGAQRTIDALVGSGKRVYFVTENPELRFQADSCINRPLRVWARDCRPDKSDVLLRQKDYLKGVKKLANVTILDSLKAFCPSEKCVVFDEGSLLYVDGDHLSVGGSRYQVKHLLSDFLE